MKVAADRVTAEKERTQIDVKLLGQLTCPHCWSKFPPEQALWVSEHVDLLGDPRLGPEQRRRFLPTRFTPGGDAIDAKGMTCGSLACPNCHLTVPRSMLEMEPLFLSILGAPSSGKSFFLAAMTWQMRKVLPLHFGLTFTDADPASNRMLNEYEESIFLNSRASRLVPLGDLIRKTELQGELYDTVAFGQQTVSFPRPFLFEVRPQPEHPNAGRATGLARILCLYDNAGEHFQPGQDSTASPVTRHLAHSRAILFLFDPTQDPRFRAKCRTARQRSSSDDSRMSRQETILNEAAARVRKYAGLAQGARQDRPLVVVLSKFDEWAHLLGKAEADDPWRVVGENPIAAFDLDRVEAQSGDLRGLMARECPEIVAAAEGFARDVTYIASSSLGGRTEIDPATGFQAIRPKEVQPHWVTVPLLYAIYKTLPGAILKLTRRSRKV